MRLLFFAMVMGVLSLQSCTSYRIKVVEFGSIIYCTPEKRTLFSWEEIYPFYGNDLSSAKKTIDDDKSRKSKRNIYIKY